MRNNVSECEKEETVSVIVQLIKVSKSEREREEAVVLESIKMRPRLSC